MFCYRCGEDIDFKEDWVKFIDEGDWLYHWKCYLLAKENGYMPKPDFIHRKGARNENPNSRNFS